MPPDAECVKTSGKCAASCRHLLLSLGKLRRLTSDEGWRRRSGAIAERGSFQEKGNGLSEGNRAKVHPPSEAARLRVDMTPMNN